MKQIIFIAIAILVISTSSCRKEDISPTQGELTAAKIKSDISHTNASINSVYISFNNGTGSFSGTTYSISSDGFIIVFNSNGSTTFNLGQLKFYQIYSQQLSLYF